MPRRAPFAALLGALHVAACYTSVPEHDSASDGATSASSSGSIDTTGAPTTGSTSTAGDTGGGATGGASTAMLDTTGDASTGTTTDAVGTTTDAATGTTGTTGADALPLPPDCPRVQVTVMPGNTLNIRPTPSTAGAPLGKLAAGEIVDALALVHGELVDGSDLWFEIATPDITGFVLAAYVQCTTEEPPVLEPPAGFWLPLECGKSAKISQGNFGDFSHQGKAAYAFDFAIPVGTPMVAMADGQVLHTYADTMPGDPCYDGGGPECFPYANLVVLLHGDGTTTLYKHLSEVHVDLGAFVPRGEVVGLSGSTGYSTGPHAHTMRMEDCGATNCQSIPLQFVDVPGDGVPDTDQTVTSMNCP
jgi:hypothetical protein